MPLPEGQPFEIGSDGEKQSHGTFTADGKYYYFGSERDGDSSWALKQFSVPDPRAVGTFFVNSWSPDDDKIAYAGFEDGVWNLFWISRTTKEKRQLTRNAAPRVYLRYPEWSPDGKKMAYEFNESKGNVYIAREK